MDVDQLLEYLSQHKEILIKEYLLNKLQQIKDLIDIEKNRGENG